MPEGLSTLINKEVTIFFNHGQQVYAKVVAIDNTVSPTVLVVEKNTSGVIQTEIIPLASVNNIKL